MANMKSQKKPSARSKSPKSRISKASGSSKGQPKAMGPGSGQSHERYMK